MLEHAQQQSPWWACSPAWVYSAARGDAANPHGKLWAGCEAHSTFGRVDIIFIHLIDFFLIHKSSTYYIKLKKFHLLKYDLTFFSSSIHWNHLQIASFITNFLHQTKLSLTNTSGYYILHQFTKWIRMSWAE